MGLTIRAQVACHQGRGLLSKGLMTCHGVGGNTWMMLYAAQQLGEVASVIRQHLVEGAIGVLESAVQSEQPVHFCILE